MQPPSLSLLINQLFGVEIPPINPTDFDTRLPTILKELYTIEAYFAQHNCAFETIRFFCNLNSLVPYAQLKLDEPEFVFAHENQYNWACKMRLDSDRVFYQDRVEPQNSRWLDTNLQAFLTSFALHEVGFSLSCYFGHEYEKIEEIEAVFQKTEHLWVDANFIFSEPVSYYLIDETCLIGFGGLSVFATQHAEKLEQYQRVLKHYRF